MSKLPCCQFDSTNNIEATRLWYNSFGVPLPMCLYHFDMCLDMFDNVILDEYCLVAMSEQLKSLISVES